MSKSETLGSDQAIQCSTVLKELNAYIRYRFSLWVYLYFFLYLHLYFFLNFPFTTTSQSRWPASRVGICSRFLLTGKFFRLLPLYACSGAISQFSLWLYKAQYRVSQIVHYFVEVQVWRYLFDRPQYFILACRGRQILALLYGTKLVYTVFFTENGHIKILSGIKKKCCKCNCIMSSVIAVFLHIDKNILECIC